MQKDDASRNAGSGPTRKSGEGLLIEVRVRPRSHPGWKRDATGGLVLGVSAGPVDGGANEEALRAIAKAVGVSRSRVALHRGARSRLKVFAVAGVDEAQVRRRLEHLTTLDP